MTRVGSRLTAAHAVTPVALATALWACSSVSLAQNSTAGSAASPSTATPATAQPKNSSKTGATGDSSKMKAPTNAKLQASYSIGVSMGEQLHRAGLTISSVSTERLAQGLRDSLAGKVTMSQKDQENITALVKSVREGLADTNHSAAGKFLTENGKKPDVITTASGLQYHVVAPGEGESPKPTDQVTVNYRGTLLDGTEFDSSYKRGQPATFPVNGVIPGWREALVLMKPGAKWELFVPPKLAYDLNSPPPIPPGSMLKFDVELISVKQAPPPPVRPMPPPAAPSSR